MTSQQTQAPREQAPGPQALALTRVSKSFRAHLWLRAAPVLRGLSLAVAPGTIHGLLGPNGAGKTTTIRIALALVRPDSGEARIFGKPVSDPRARIRVGFLPENPYFYDYLTGREFLDLSARLAGNPGTGGGSAGGSRASARAARAGEVERLLRAVGMAGRAGIPLRRCSKGMVQRIGMAQALLGEPDLIILDEPMSGLDPIGRREIRDLILEQRKAGKTVFFSSHILQDAEMICDRVSIIDRGMLVAEGSLDSLLAGEIRSWEVAVSTPGGSGVPAALEELGKGLPGRWEVVSRSAEECLLRVRAEEDLDELIRAACASGSRVRAVVPFRETLEDLFLRRIGREDRERWA